MYRLALSGVLVASGPAFPAEPTNREAAHPAGIVLPTLPTTTLTLPPLSTSTLTLPTTTLTLPPPTITLPSPTTTLPTLPTTSLPPTTTRPSTSTTTTTSPAAGLCGALDCDDRNTCTEDRCDPSGGCRHEPVTGPACDDGDPCTGDDRCAAGLCAGTRLGCTQPPRCPESCTDDGFACTDDVCTAAGCLHVPVDSRCVPPGQCTTAVCAPGLPGADPDGCVVGAPQPDGDRCAEDTDACTVDVCRAGVCAHERGADPTGCEPVQGAFRQTIALGAITRDLLASVIAAVPGGVESLVARLTGIQASLAAAERALAGEEPGSASAVIHPAVASGVPANVRARIAFTHVLRTPRAVAGFLEEVRRAQLRAAISRSVGKALLQGGRRLLNGTRALKADLRRLQGGAANARSGQRGRRDRPHRLLHGPEARAKAIAR